MNSAPINRIKPTCLDFFAGSGLVSEGLKKYFDIVWANDICEKKRDVYSANHPSDVFHLGPVEEIGGADLPSATLSWGSFPCQDLSVAGSMHGINGANSGLVWQWLRVMDELEQRPPIVVAENVVGLISALKGKHYIDLHNALVERGYRVGAVVMDASYWVPQSRKRVFVIAVEQDFPIEAFESPLPTWCHPESIVRVSRGLEHWVWWALPKPKLTRPDVESIVDFSAPCHEPEKTEALLNIIPPRHKRNMELLSRIGAKVFPAYKRRRNGKMVLELRFDGIAGCLRTPRGGSSRQFLVLRENGSYRTRLITVKEAAAMMGVRKSYRLPGSYNDGYKAMGDAVAVPVTRYLAKELLYPIACEINRECVCDDAR